MRSERTIYQHNEEPSTCRGGKSNTSRAMREYLEQLLLYLELAGLVGVAALV